MRRFLRRGPAAALLALILVVIARGRPGWRRAGGDMMGVSRRARGRAALGPGDAGAG